MQVFKFNVYLWHRRSLFFCQYYARALLSPVQVLYLLLCKFVRAPSVCTRNDIFPALIVGRTGTFLSIFIASDFALIRPNTDRQTHIHMIQMRIRAINTLASTSDICRRNTFVRRRTITTCVCVCGAGAGAGASAYRTHTAASAR